jgi:glucose-1-phosphate adenylyltransferase
MTAINRALVIIMAGGAGERLLPLTENRTKPSIPFGGKFRLIDITLSNCINSGLRQIFILTQYRSASLHKHIQEGWDISSSGLGDFIYCMPAQQKVGAEWYQGTADSIRQNLDLIKGKDNENIIILSGDHVYKMNYLQMVAFHQTKKAGLTISAIRLKKEQAAGRFGVLEVGNDYRAVGFEEKPVQPKTMADAPEYAFVSMGIYTFKIGVLREALRMPGDDFGRDIIPAMIGNRFDVCIYDYEKENKIEDFVVEVAEGKRNKVLTDRTRDSSYWRDVGSIESYFEASMDLVSVNPIFNLYGENWPLRTYQRSLPPIKCVIGGKILESIVSDGCIISGGTVRNSILSPCVIVEKDSLVEESIIFDDVIIEPRAKIKRAIIDKEARIQAGASVGYDSPADKEQGCTISDTGLVIVPRGIVIGQG